MLYIVGENTINITVDIGYNQKNSFSFISKEVHATGDIVTIKQTKNNNTIMIGTIKTANFDSKTNLYSYTGLDCLSYWCEQNMCSYTMTNQHTAGDLLRFCIPDTTINTPAMTLAPIGVISTNPISLLNRICGFCGWIWYIIPTERRIEITDQIPQHITEGRAISGVNELNITQNVDNLKSSVTVQRINSNMNSTEIIIQNSITQGVATENLINPNAVEQEVLEGEKLFPKDYWLDPWTKAFCTIKCPYPSISYPIAMQCQGAKIEYLSCNDSISPGWKMGIYEADPGRGSDYLLARIDINDIYICEEQHTFAFVRIERVVDGVLVFPTYDGVKARARISQDRGSDTSPSAWVGVYYSGDEGTPDYNIISDNLLPEKNTYDYYNCGDRVAQLDSTLSNKNISCPHDNEEISLGEAIKYNNSAFTVLQLKYNSSGSSSSKNVLGED